MLNITYFSRLFLTMTCMLFLIFMSNQLHVSAEDIIPPDVSITAPVDGSYTQSKMITGTTEPLLPVTVYIDGVQTDTFTSDDQGTWSYTAANLPDGDHDIYVTVLDEAGNEGLSATIGFVLDTIRPIVLPALSPVPDMTQVSVNPLIQIQFADASPMDMNTIGTAIILSANGAIINGTVSYDSMTKQLTFIPDSPLNPNTKYYVYVNDALTDTAGNPIHPRTWSFTTQGSTDGENPHGNYSNNVNVCSNCHSTHIGNAPGLTKTAYPSIDQYCIACHDGTAAPVPENWEGLHKHDFQVSIKGTRGTSSCASCHNPHLNWETNNPNLIQDYYKYDHPQNPTNPDGLLPNSSEEQLCEACHQPEIKEDPRVIYESYQYKKRHSSSGIPDDYKLCLRCHNGTNAIDVDTFYNQPESVHNINALDGSPLNGPLPCAECHETHGSDNIKLLKEELGHNQILGKFNQTDGSWTPEAERAFCMKCHNNTTEMYGIIMGLREDIDGHLSGGCSSCHGRGSFIEAAHAPKKP